VRNAHRLHAFGVAADMMYLDARRDLGRSVVELDASGRPRNAPDAHSSASCRAASCRGTCSGRGEIHFLVLQMVAGGWRQRNVAGVVVVHMVMISLTFPLDASALMPSATA